MTDDEEQRYGTVGTLFASAAMTRVFRRFVAAVERF
jgi:hypothetical protein